jgi:hypothetical protein
VVRGQGSEVLVIREGCTRRVFLIGQYAIKVATWSYGLEFFLKGLLHNLREKRSDRLASDPRRCPVLFGCALFIVMPRCEPRAEPLTDAELWPFFAPDSCGCYLSAVLEDKPENFGYLDGRLVMLDYAGW